MLIKVNKLNNKSRFESLTNDEAECKFSENFHIFILSFIKHNM